MTEAAKNEAAMNKAVKNEAVMTQETSSMIRVRGLRKAFGEKKVLNGLDLDVARGESLVVLGGSGSGKSVLLKHLIGLLRPDEGSVVVDGIDIHGLDRGELTDFRRRYGMSFQEGALFDSMSVGENVGFPLTRQRPRKARREIQARVEECLGLVGLDGTAHKMPSELSGGMRRRVGFARSIVLEPEILLFDEPTTGLDPIMTAVIDDIILGMRRQLGSTAITITHDLKSAFRIADRVAMLHKGRILAVETAERFQQLDDPRIRQFLDGRAEGPMTSDQPDLESSPA